MACNDGYWKSFPRPELELVWLPRTFIAVADLVAKISLRNNVVLIANEFSVGSVIVDKLAVD